MMQKLSYIISRRTLPYSNQALEEELLQGVEEGEVILYLWQNRDTIVLGRNQSSRAECLAEELTRDGGYVARRLSGGGAVFHDLGNLNFTFLAAGDSYDLDAQTEVILEAVRSLGIAAEKTGRNDLTVQGRKFSGNAFYTTGGRKLHHGTILINSQMETMSRYLTVPEDKLKSKGVRSVRSRVVNLSQLAPELTVQSVQDALLASFGKVYGGVPRPLDTHRLDAARMTALEEKFSSAQWRLGSEGRQYSNVIKKRFPWGGAELCLAVEEGMIAGVVLYTDALDDRISGRLEKALAGVGFSLPELKTALQAIRCDSRQEREAVTDIEKMMEDYLNGAV